MTAQFPNVLRSRLAQACVAALMSIAAPSAMAANVSLTGNLFQDNSVQFLTLTLSGAGAITVTGLGYAGGTDHYGNAVAAGGFDTWIGLYSSAGALLHFSDDGGSVPTDPNTGEALDSSFTTGNLAAGVYTLALTQADNTPLSFNLSDGFWHASNANFTSAYGCSNGQFCDYTGANRTSSWTLNFSGQTLVSVVPEPGSLALVLAAGGALLAFRRPRPVAGRALAAA